MGRLSRCWGILGVAALAACGDSGSEAGPSDAGPNEGDAAGPSDNADAVEVEVPVEPRAFLLGAGLPSEALELASSQLAWSTVSLETEIATVWIDAGVPWAELLAGDPLPAEVDAWLATLEAGVGRIGGDVMLVVDPLNAGRTALADDLLGRALDASPSLGDPDVDAAWAEWVALLAGRLRADWVAPLVEPNLYLAGRRGEDVQQATVDGLVSMYTAARRAVQDADAAVRVFPIWDLDTLPLLDDETLPAQQSLFVRLDERQDAMAVQYNPADALRSSAELQAGELAFLSELSRRPLAIVGTGYPAAGFTRNDRIFASSENSQFNYLAWLFAEADALGAELVVWRFLVDPNEILAAPCPAGDSACIGTGVELRFERWRSSGLTGARGQERRALELWRQYRERPVRGR